MIKIIPAILAKTYEEFENMVKKIEPYADTVHLDIADGEFVPSRTIGGYEELKKINTKLNFEIHLMVNNPESQISHWLETPVVEQSSLRGTAKAVRYLVHWESTHDYDAVINQFGVNGKEFGFVFNPRTDYSAIEPYIDRIDLVQFMTVDPGFYGSPFLPEVLERIRNFHNQYPGKIIQVDGGVNPETVKLIEEAGASRAAVGSYIFQNPNVEKALVDLSI